MKYQHCIKCDDETRRCTEDQLTIGDYGPLCEDCFDGLTAALEDGNKCPDPNCDGEMMIKPTKNCSCHISPPCYDCINAPLICSDCSWELEA